MEGKQILVKTITERYKDGIVHYISEAQKAPLPKSGFVEAVGKEVSNTIEVGDTVFFDYKRTRDFKEGYVIVEERFIKLCKKE